MLRTAIGRILGFAIGALAPKWLVWAFAKHFIAGRGQMVALGTMRRLNKLGFSVSVDYIGEEIADCNEIHRVKVEYLSLIEAMEMLKVHGDVSLKLSHFGLLQEEDAPYFVCSCGKDALEAILARAAQSRIRVWIDAERLALRDDTWLIVPHFSKYHRWMGVCIQAYAEDACDFMKARIREGYHGLDSISIRVCKGAYREPERRILTGAALEDNFIELCKLVLKEDLYLQIATHDEKLIRRIGGDGPREHGMLLGVNPELAERLVVAGKNVKIYTPYGEDFKGYVARRIAERPQYIFLPLRRT